MAEAIKLCCGPLWSLLTAPRVEESFSFSCAKLKKFVPFHMWEFRRRIYAKCYPSSVLLGKFNSGTRILLTISVVIMWNCTVPKPCSKKIKNGQPSLLFSTIRHCLFLACENSARGKERKGLDGMKQPAAATKER